MTTLDTSPAEVLHAICAVLCPKDVAALRLTSSVLAKIGAHYLVRKVTFHTSQASLDRLQKIGDHKVFRQYVDEVHFEANLLANICCRDCWERRFVKASLDAGTSQLKEPKPPTSPTTVREKRLYSRNLKKWEEDVVDSTFHDHHTRREDQQKLHQQGPELMTKIMPQFPRLRKVRFTIARCHHALSTRFQEDFKTKLGICAPVSADTAPTGAQLKHIIAPGRKALQNLQELIISDLDPSLFEPVEGSSIMCRAFTNLKKLDISFRLPESTEQSTEPGLYDALQKGGLRDAIAWAEDLEELRVAFNGYTIDGPCIELKNILGNKSLNRLKKLSIGCVEADAKGFIEILSRQKSLKQLAMYCVSIKGSWVDVLDEMRRNLALTDATFDGFLMDDEQMYEMESSKIDHYMECHEEFTAGTAMRTYLTDSFVEDNPLKSFDNEYADRETLNEMWHEMMAEMSEDCECDDCIEEREQHLDDYDDDEDDDDDSMPDLDDMPDLVDIRRAQGRAFPD